MSLDISQNFEKLERPALGNECSYMTCFWHLQDSNKRPAKEAQLPAEKRLKAEKLDSTLNKANENKIEIENR